jgi:hypothetical protein
LERDALAPREDEFNGETVALDGTEQVRLQDGQVLINGIPLEAIDIESWELAPLRNLFRSIQRLQVVTNRACLMGVPAEHLFVSNQNYVDKRRWHEDTVFVTGQREVTSDTGEPVTEHGYVEVPRVLCPDAYTLRDAVVRTYKAPAYRDHLMQEGLQYQEEVLARHPNAIADISPDLTKWIFVKPDGTVAGWKSFPINGDN